MGWKILVRHRPHCLIRPQFARYMPHCLTQAFLLDTCPIARYRSNCFIQTSVRLSIVPPPPHQMPPNGHPLLPNPGRLLRPVSQGCCRVHNADVQFIPVKSNLYSPVRPSSHWVIHTQTDSNLGWTRDGRNSTPWLSFTQEASWARDMYPARKPFG